MTSTALQDSAVEEMLPDVRYIPLDQLHESPDNPRQYFDPVSLAALGASLKDGQTTSLLVRPRVAGGFEIAAGHRRYRAAKLVGLKSLRCEVTEMDDQRFLVVLNIENLQRDDLNALEEARGYANMIKSGEGWNVARIADEMKMSVEYVYARLKLLKLIPQAQKLFLEGHFETAHAIELARLSTADQARALGLDEDGAFHPSDIMNSGLFQPERAESLFTPAEDEAGVDDDGAAPSERLFKAKSSREFKAWINRHVRFRPEQIDQADLLMHHPETAKQLEVALADKAKIIAITYDYKCDDDTRDEHERTYGVNSWKRADGREKSKPCEYVVLGVVKAGPGRGDAFDVCVAKKKCTVHWAAEIKEAEKRAKASAGGSNRAAAKQDTWQEQQRRQQEEQKRRTAEGERWLKVVPRLLEALALRMGKLPLSTVAEDLLEDIGGRMDKKNRGLVEDAMPVGKSAEETMRHCVFLHASQPMFSTWNVVGYTTQLFKGLGLDAKKIVDQAHAAAKPAAVKPVTPAPKPSASKKSAKVSKPAAKKKASKKR